MLQSPRQKVLIVAFCFDPEGTMEERNGWQRALIAAQRYDVTVLYSPKVNPTDFQLHVPEDLRSHLHFQSIELTGFSKWMLDHEQFFYFAYRLWHRKAYAMARKLHQQRRFDLTHLVTLCGFREPGEIWKLDAVHIWGPIGGFHNFPLSMIRVLDLRSKFWEIVRAGINHYQIHYSRRVRLAASACTVVAATKQSALAIRAGLRTSVSVDLETGIDYPIRPAREPRDEQRPIRILWAGRLRAWKALPLLLHSLSKLPDDVDFELRVLGDGDCRAGWQNLAVELGLNDKIQWIAWPNYRETLPHYDWADLFAFTSLRDTSGTGLVEALAAGCPLLSVNHQGAADLLEHDCGAAIELESYESVVEGFKDAIIRMARDNEYWLQKSHSATAYAHQLHWSARADWQHQLYEQALELVDADSHASAQNSIETPVHSSASSAGPDTLGYETEGNGKPTEHSKHSTPSIALSTRGGLDGLVALGDQAVVSFTNFVTILLLARACDDTVFAAIALAAQFINYSRTAIERFLSSAYAAFVHRPEEDKAALTGSSLVHSIIFTSLVTFLAGIAALLNWRVSASQILAFGLLTQCLLLPLQMLRDHFRSIALSQLRIAYAFGLDVVSSVIQLGLLLLMLSNERVDSLSISLAWSLANLVFLALWFIRPPTSYTVRLVRLLSDWQETWGYSKWLVFGRCLGIASYLFVPWLLAIIKGEEQCALFAKALTLVGLSVMLVTGLNSYFQPQTVRSYYLDGLTAMKKVMRNTSIVYATLLIGLSCVYAVGGYGLMSLLFHTDDNEQGRVLTLLGLNVLAFSLAIVASNGLTAIKLSRANFWGELANFSLSVLVAVPLISLAGTIGAALSILLGSLASAVVTTWTLSRHLSTISEKRHQVLASKGERD